MWADTIISVSSTAYIPFWHLWSSLESRSHSFSYFNMFWTPPTFLLGVSLLPKIPLPLPHMKGDAQHWPQVWPDKAEDRDTCPPTLRSLILRVTHSHTTLALFIPISLNLYLSPTEFSAICRHQVQPGLYASWRNLEDRIIWGPEHCGYSALLIQLGTKKGSIPHAHILDQIIDRYMMNHPWICMYTSWEGSRGPLISLPPRKWTHQTLAAKGPAGHFRDPVQQGSLPPVVFESMDKEGLGEVLWTEGVTIWCLDFLGTHSVNRCALAQQPYGEAVFKSPPLPIAVTKLPQFPRISSLPPMSPQPAAKDPKWVGKSEVLLIVSLESD